MVTPIVLLHQTLEQVVNFPHIFHIKIVGKDGFVNDTLLAANYRAITEYVTNGETTNHRFVGVRLTPLGYTIYAFVVNGEEVHVQLHVSGVIYIHRAH